MKIDVATGWLDAARQVISPNADDRPPGTEPELIVIHGISLPPGQFGGPEIEQFFCNRLDTTAHPFFQEIENLRVSSHLLIRRNGELVQFVPFHRRAWHAGVSTYCGRSGCNDFSIGIELEGTDEIPYTDSQYKELLTVIDTLCAAYKTLDNHRVVGHCHISPERKTDPGPAFDWVRLASSRC